MVPERGRDFGMPLQQVVDRGLGDLFEPFVRARAHALLRGFVRIPYSSKEEPACKPDSVPAPRGARGDHLSGSRVAAALVQPTREHRTGRPLPAWPCSGWGI